MSPLDTWGRPRGRPNSFIAKHGVHPVLKDLRAKRISLGLTQFQLAAEVGYGPKTISEYESGKIPMSLRRLVDLLDAVGLELCTREKH